jgi:AhpC/TSA family
MNGTVGIISVLVLSAGIATQTVWDDTSAPQQQYSAILKAYTPASGELRNATTDLERKAAVEKLATFSSKFLELAAEYPGDPVALVALRQAVQAVGSTDSAAQITWETNRAHFPSGNTDGSAVRTVTLVLRDHILSEKLGPVIDRMRYGYRLEYETCLRIVLEKNPHRDVQALACLALAQFLNDRLRMLQLTEDRPELADCYNIVFGTDYLPALQRLGRAELGARIEELFERAANEYADVTFRSGTVGETAASELYDIRHLSVGKVAPEIAGKDQDGRIFKLSDYRGKVVLLYFWSEF